MKKLLKLFTALSFIILAIGFAIVLTQLRNTRSELKSLKSDVFEVSGENLVTMQLSFIGCACGIDYPQYHVDSVLQSESDKYGHTYYVNKEVNLRFDDLHLQKLLTQNDCSGTCYSLELTGNIGGNQFGMHTLAVSSGKILRNYCCPQLPNLEQKK
jgi:hypothetical protein